MTADINGLVTATKYDNVGRALVTYETASYPTTATVTSINTYDAQGRLLTSKDREQSKGGSTLYRARFSGFDEVKAASACKSLQRTGFSCFAVRGG